MPTNLLLLITVATFFRLVLGILFPLTADESYYWLWSKHLALSYVDHPPMIALVNYLMTLGQANLLTLRFGAALISLGIALLIYFISLDAFNRKVAFWATVLFLILPHYLVIWLTQFVELPLALFWSLALWLMVKIVKTQQKYYWYLLGIVVGLGTLSKYTMFLFWPCLIIFFLISPANRFWLKRKQPYLCLGLSLGLFSPVLVWNSRLAWVSFVFHGAKAGSAAWGSSLLPFIGDQLVHFTPFLIFTLIPVFAYSLKRNDLSRLLFAFSFPVLFVFLLLSLKVKVWAHWPSIGYLAALPLTVAYLDENGKSLKRFILWIALFTSLILVILFWVSPGVLLHQKDYARNRELSALFPKEKIFARTNVSASLLEFYTGRQTYMATGFLKPGPLWGEKQYELWGIPNLTQAESVIYYGEDTKEFRRAAMQNFTSVALLADIKMNLIEDYIADNYHFFRLAGFKGTGHP
ncbi:MAG: glycosyltransferase family 39 protein [Candidatus Margulisbacteria bacterium]|nr:glycosyltransferase family 39 protein [Candidatus Margulisiibacteriota bacterium]MBU1616599.1 glycosyltransferase family 39 protein [Candidatus Margulisiibacteriota bacterium]MBU1867604.1 glycosyltransferase family 39 protein [Candidatus Margulisiibacteriota bacterium]